MYCAIYTNDCQKEVFGPFIDEKEVSEWCTLVQETKGWPGRFFITSMDDPRTIIYAFPLTPIPHWYDEGCGAFESIDAISLEDFKKFLPSHE
jgi:hypothetical protein